MFNPITPQDRTRWMLWARGQLARAAKDSGIEAQAIEHARDLIAGAAEAFGWRVSSRALRPASVIPRSVATRDPGLDRDLVFKDGDPSLRSGWQRKQKRPGCPGRSMDSGMSPAQSASPLSGISMTPLSLSDVWRVTFPSTAPFLTLSLALTTTV